MSDDDGCGGKDPGTEDVIDDALDASVDRAHAYGRARRPAMLVVAMLYDHDRLAVDFADRHLPGRRRALVLAEVWRVVEASREAIGDTNARVGADQLAQAVPVPAVESFDVQPQQLGERGARSGFGGRR